MRIVHLCSSDLIGGAARAAYRLHEGLCRLGQNSVMFVGERRSSDPTVVVFSPMATLLERLQRRWRQEQILRDSARYHGSRPNGLEMFSDDRSKYGAYLMQCLPTCDLIHLHWVAGFVDYRAVFRALPKQLPVVWTLHDMNPFTGGCHYDAGCRKYRKRCGSCPQLGSLRERDLSRRVLERKRRAFEALEQKQLHVVAPSRWLATEASTSSLLGRFARSVIPYGIDVKVFTPRKKSIAREALMIPRAASVLLFIAQSVNNSRKGFKLLQEALLHAAEIPNLMLVSVGDSSTSPDLPVPHLHLGRIESDHILALVYSAADVFVIPSLQDNLPNTVIESLACGTPVVGFSVGGIPDLVRPGITGYLCPPGDTEGMRSCMIRLLQDKNLRLRMAENCRHAAIEEYHLELQARRYVALYQSLLEAGNTVPVEAAKPRHVRDVADALR